MFFFKQSLATSSFSSFHHSFSFQQKRRNYKAARPFVHFTNKFLLTFPTAVAPHSTVSVQVNISIVSREEEDSLVWGGGNRVVFEFALKRRAFCCKGQAALLAVLWRLVTCQHTIGPEVIKNLTRVTMTSGACSNKRNSCASHKIELRSFSGWFRIKHKFLHQTLVYLHLKQTLTILWKDFQQSSIVLLGYAYHKQQIFWGMFCFQVCCLSCRRSKRQKASVCFLWFRLAVFPSVNRIWALHHNNDSEVSVVVPNNTPFPTYWLYNQRLSQLCERTFSYLSTAGSLFCWEDGKLIFVGKAII